MPDIGLCPLPAYKVIEYGVGRKSPMGAMSGMVCFAMVGQLTIEKSGQGTCQVSGITTAGCFPD